MPETNPENNQEKPNETPDNGGGSVSIEQFNSMANELKKFKTMAEELDAKLKDKDLQSMKNGQKWEEVAKLKEDEAKAAKTELNDWKKAMTQDKKVAAIREEALKHKIRPESMEDLENFDFGDLVQVEATISQNGSKRIAVSGASNAIAYLKQKRPHWFNDGKAPNVNSTTPGANTTTEGGDKVTGKMVADAYAKFVKSKDPKDHDEYVSLNKKLIEQKQQARAH